MRFFALSLILLPTLCSCQKKESPQPPGTGNEIKPVSVPVTPVIAEASGIADSKSRKNALWVIEDSGNPPELVLLGHDGKVQERIGVTGATNRDWEDLVLEKGRLYIADIGDNNQVQTEYRIYRMDEPGPRTTSVSKVETIRFRYADGSHDAEAILVQPQTEDIYIITKRDAQSLVFKLEHPYSFSNVNVARKVGELGYNTVVSAALAPNAREIMVKTYSKIFRYARQGNEPLEATLARTPEEAPYVQEPQGESLCYKLDNSGYFTLTEQLLNLPVNLYFYHRK